MTEPTELTDDHIRALWQLRMEAALELSYERTDCPGRTKMLTDAREAIDILLRKVVLP